MLHDTIVIVLVFVNLLVLILRFLLTYSFLLYGTILLDILLRGKSHPAYGEGITNHKIN